MTDTSIRPVTIAEQADEAARRCVETGEPQRNPHEPGSHEFLLWHNAYSRYLLLHSSPADVEGGA